MERRKVSVPGREREKEEMELTQRSFISCLRYLYYEESKKNAVVSIAPKKTQNGERESRKKNERYVQRLSEEEPLR